MLLNPPARHFGDNNIDVIEQSSTSKHAHRFTEMQESYGEEQRDRGLKGAILVVQETTEK